jgi:hypothetical protein
LRSGEGEASRESSFEDRPGARGPWSVCVRSEESLAHFDGYHETSPLDLWSHSIFKEFANDSKVAFAKPNLGKFAFASPHSANSQYLTNTHTSGPVKQRPIAMARST